MRSQGTEAAMTTDLLRITDQSLSRHDPRRGAIDEECDELVDLWLGARG